MDFARLIDQLIAQGWTQGKLAIAAGTTQGHLSQIRTRKVGKRSPHYDLGVRLIMVARETPLGLDPPPKVDQRTLPLPFDKPGQATQE